MSILIEEIPLIEFERTPPCEVLYYGRICAQPSVERIITSCRVCGKKAQFVCSRCLDELLLRKGICTSCLNPRPVTGHL